MSLKLNSSGGGSVTLQEPTTASNVTLNLPAADGTVVYENASGTVGIGTSSPAYKLQANAGNSNNNNDANTIVATGTNHVRLKVHTPTTGGFRASLVLSSDEAVTATGNEVSISTTGSDEMQFATSGTERARIDSSGNLLVGKTSSDLSTPGFGVDIRSGVLNGVSIIKNDGQWGTALFIRRNTGVGTGAVAEFNYDGTTTGTIGITATTTAYNTSSDYRLKENVQPMTGALAKVAALKPCAYTWKADGSNGQGFIAHELAEVVPDAVTGEKDAVNEDGSIKPQGIDTSFLVATLTAAIQEQQAMIEELKAKVAALEAQ
jgi:hypothetical protein